MSVDSVKDHEFPRDIYYDEDFFENLAQTKEDHESDESLEDPNIYDNANYSDPGSDSINGSDDDSVKEVFDEGNDESEKPIINEHIQEDTAVSIFNKKETNGKFY